MIKIKEDFLTKNEYSRPMRELKDVLGIVIHYVGVPAQRAAQTVSYFESLKHGKNKIYASAHYIIDLDGSVIHCIPNNELAYHCGAEKYKDGICDKLGSYPNLTTLGIELCHNKDGFTMETINSAVELASNLLKAYDLTEKDLYRHYDITGKLCPKFYVEHEDSWEAFKNAVMKKLS
jgi:N-acetylmuramoyl-L-alanine amidase CwlA